MTIFFEINFFEINKFALFQVGWGTEMSIHLKGTMMSSKGKNKQLKHCT